jgi:hypothetical protein
MDWTILLTAISAIFASKGPRNTRESEGHSPSAGVQGAGPLASAGRAIQP